VPQVIVTEAALEGLERCRQFLQAKASEAARRAGQAIEQQLLLLETAPNLGRPHPELPELREPVITFGDSGYVALYRYEPVKSPCISWPFRIRGKPVTNPRESKRQADQPHPVWPVLSFARFGRHTNVSQLKSHRAPLNSCACCCFISSSGSSSSVVTNASTTRH